MTFLQHIDKRPPWVVRVVGRKKRGPGKFAPPYSRREIVERSGLSPKTVTRITFRKTWDGIDAGTISRFADALGVDILKREQFYEFVRKYGKRRYEGFTAAQKRKFMELEKGV